MQLWLESIMKLDTDISDSNTNWEYQPLCVREIVLIVTILHPDKKKMLSIIHIEMV